MLILGQERDFTGSQANELRSWRQKESSRKFMNCEPISSGRGKNQNFLIFPAPGFRLWFLDPESWLLDPSSVDEYVTSLPVDKV
ncbi:hypothetical protein AVEN_208484-1 [Araneus ventricosus]|uniref:Uncharacterized protein n=1 Tax=Araneus ventricosus TaxID=182803 RepID=A0A4Y2I3X7_ARAVE|nr:hypothetical protein AVEN_208484-1 [Araneus ventricosus]